MTVKLKCEVQEGAVPKNIGGKSILGRGNSLNKGESKLGVLGVVNESLWLEHRGEGWGCMRYSQGGGLGPLYKGPVSEDRDCEVVLQYRSELLEIFSRGVT